jgi:hypothetical protein
MLHLPKQADNEKQCHGASHERMLICLRVRADIAKAKSYLQARILLVDKVCHVVNNVCGNIHAVSSKGEQDPETGPNVGAPLSQRFVK